MNTIIILIIITMTSALAALLTDMSKKGNATLLNLNKTYAFLTVAFCLLCVLSFTVVNYLIFIGK